MIICCHVSTERDRYTVKIDILLENKIQLPLILYGAESHQVRYENLDKHQLSRAFFIIVFILFFCFTAALPFPGFGCAPCICNCWLQVSFLKWRKDPEPLNLGDTSSLNGTTLHRVFKDACFYPQCAWITSSPLCLLPSRGAITHSLAVPIMFSLNARKECCRRRTRFPRTCLTK